jgi:hypothetical protein
MSASTELCVSVMGSTSAHADSARQSLSDSTRPLILLAIADDEVRARFAYQLAALGFDVVMDIATDPVRARRPDVVVADLTRNVSRERRLAGIPVVAVVDDVGDTTRTLARRSGAAAACLSTCTGAALAAGVRALLDMVRV